MEIATELIRFMTGLKPPVQVVGLHTHNDSDAILHLVLPARRDVPQHHVDDECTIQCLEGDVEVRMPIGTRR